MPSTNGQRASIEGDRATANRLAKPVFLSFATVIVSLSASVVLAADPVIGTWQLNPTKTSPALAALYKSQTRTYSQAGTGLSLVIKTVLADGKESTTQTTYQLDGKDYPVTGDPNYDSLSGSPVADRRRALSPPQSLWRLYVRRSNTPSRAMHRCAKLLHYSTREVLNRLAAAVGTPLHFLRPRDGSDRDNHARPATRVELLCDPN